MVTLELYRTNTVIPELYGKILLDGKHVATEGTSSVFENFLRKGILSSDNTVLFPQDGESYLNSLKSYLQSQGLSVTRS